MDSWEENHEPCSHSGIVRVWLRSGIPTRRYRLPWLRLVSGIRFVRGNHEALQITVASFRSDPPQWVRFVKALQIAVASFRSVAGALGEWRQLARHGFGEPVAPGNGPVSGSCYRASPEYRGFVSQRLTALGSFRQGVTDYRGFVSSAEFGSLGEIDEALQIAVASFRQRLSVRSGRSTRRYRLPWLRFVNDFRFVRGDRRGVTDCRGFVSSTAGVGLRTAAPR